jgi:hypothetical protein
MFPYLFLFAFAAYLYLNQNASKITLGVFSFFMILICGFRDMIGGFDVYIYAEIFENINKDYFNEYFELGFVLYFKIIRFLGSSRELMFFSTALLMIGLHTSTISKDYSSKGVAIFIYFCKFFLFTFVYLRQGLAMGILWLAIPYLLANKRWKAYVLVGLAFFFHKTALVFALLVLVCHYQFKKQQFFIIMSVAAAVALTPVGTFAASFFSENIDQKYEGYAAQFTEVNFLYVIEAGLLIFLLLKYRLSFYQTPKGTLVFNGVVLYTFFIVLSLTNATFVRLSWYFLIFYCFGLAYIYSFITQPKWRFTYRLVVFVYFSLVFFRLLIYYDGGDFMPYKSIFEDFDRGGMWEHMEYK